MTRRVLVLSYAFPPLAEPGTFRTIRFVRYLNENGWEPIVLTVTPKSYGTRVLDDGLQSQIPRDTLVVHAPIWQPAQRLWRWAKRIRRTNAAGSSEAAKHVPQAEVVDGATSLPRRSATTDAMGFLVEMGKLLFATPDTHTGWFLPACAKAVRMVRRYKPSAIYSTSPPHSAHLIAVVVGGLTGLPVILDLRDPWARGRTTGNDESRIRRATQLRLESICVQRAARVILNTARLREEFQEHYVSEIHDRLEVIPNGYDPEQLPTIQKLVREDNGVRRGDELRICHPGNVYGRRDIVPLLAAIKQLSEEGVPVTFEQIGIVNSAEAVDYLRKHDLADTVKMTNRRLPHRETIQRMSAADVLVVIRNNTPLQVPAKTYEMLMFKKPIVALDDGGATAEMVQRYNLGVVADPTQSERIAQAIKRVAEQRSSITNEAGWAAALDTFDGRKQTQKLASILDSVAKRSK